MALSGEDIVQHTMIGGGNNSAQYFDFIGSHKTHKCIPETLLDCLSIIPSH